jgi:hypothetical protein
VLDSPSKQFMSPFKHEFPTVYTRPTNFAEHVPILVYRKQSPPASQPSAENLKSAKSKRATSARKLKTHDSQKSDLKENEKIKIDVNPEQVYEIHHAHANASCFCDVCMAQHQEERFKNTQKNLSDVQQKRNAVKEQHDIFDLKVPGNERGFFWLMQKLLPP